MMVRIDDKYISKLEDFVDSLPEGVVEMRNSLDDEISNRVSQYKNNPFKPLYPQKTRVSQ